MSDHQHVYDGDSVFCTICHKSRGAVRRTSMSDITWTTEDGLIESSKTFGDSEGADVAITIHTNHLERTVYVECMCAACSVISEGGVIEAMGETGNEPSAEFEDGVYFMEFWHEETHHWEYGTEHDTGLRLHKKGEPA